MSELINNTEVRNDLRWRLLLTVSLGVLAACTPASARDADDSPTVWVELGGQLERINGTSAPFTPDFLMVTPTPGPYLHTKPIQAQAASRYSFDGEGSISFDPVGTDWAFTISARFGRTNGHKRLQHQTDAPPRYGDVGNGPVLLTHNQPVEKFARVKTDNSSSQTVLDFKAGKDVGLGLFGRGSTSIFSVGIRYAQFGAQSGATIRARPSYEVYNAFEPPSQKYYPKYKFMTYAFAGKAQRSFHGIGPSLSWDGSTPFAGNLHDGQFNFDWGINAAILFGRQKAKISHHTTGRYYRGKYTKPLPTYGAIPTHYTTRLRTGKDIARSKSVTVPNIGAFAGITYRIENFKMSAGYRADFFLGAMDTGIDRRETSDISFHGPFVKIGVGL